MNLRICLFVVGMSAGLATFVFAEDYGIDVQDDPKKRGYMGVLDGIPYVFFGGAPEKVKTDWSLRPRAEKTNIDIPGGGRLAYEVAEGVACVIVQKNEGDGPNTKWKVAATVWPERYTIQAAGGDCAGWYLDFEEKGSDFKNFRGTPGLGHRLILVKTPKVPRVFAIYNVSR